MFCTGAFSAEPLPALHAEPLVTVSGVSSGACFAVQFHVAHSIKPGYYNCMTPSQLAPLPSTAVLKSEAEDLARAGRIDRTSKVANARAWLFTDRRTRPSRAMWWKA